MFLVFLKILVPFLFKKTPKLCICAIHLRDFRSIEHFIKIFFPRVLPSLSKLQKKWQGSEFCGQMVEVNPENFNAEILIRDYCVKNSQKNRNIVKILKN
jgi:hypothetical protein